MGDKMRPSLVVAITDYNKKVNMTLSKVDHLVDVVETDTELQKNTIDGSQIFLAPQQINLPRRGGREVREHL